MERKGSKGQEGATINISGGTQTFHVTVAEAPRGLVRSKPISTEKKLPGKTIELKKKKLNLSERENHVLGVLVLQTFRKETTGMGEAEHSFEIENEFEPPYAGGGKVEKDDYREVIQAIKKRSKDMNPPLKPSDIAGRIIRRFGPMREKSVTSSDYLNALGTLTAAIQEYWEPPKKPSKSGKR